MINQKPSESDLRLLVDKCVEADRKLVEARSEVRRLEGELREAKMELGGQMSVAEVEWAQCGDWVAVSDDPDTVRFFKR